MQRVRYVVNGFMDVEFHADVVGLHFIFAIEHKEIVAVGWDRVCDAIRSAGSIEVGFVAVAMASLIWRQGQAKN